MRQGAVASDPGTGIVGYYRIENSEHDREFEQAERRELETDRKTECQRAKEERV